jgi:hypothetical protein
MQLLQCVQRAETGGSNYFVNASHAALYLREIDPQSYYLLSTVPVHFHRKQKEFQSIHVGPIIETDADGIKQVRHSYFTLAPFRLPFWLTMAYYHEYGWNEVISCFTTTTKCCMREKRSLDRGIYVAFTFDQVTFGKSWANSALRTNNSWLFRPHAAPSIV